MGDAKSIWRYIGNTASIMSNLQYNKTNKTKLPTSTRQTSSLRNHTLNLGVPTWQIKMTQDTYISGKKMSPDTPGESCMCGTQELCPKIDSDLLYGDGYEEWSCPASVNLFSWDWQGKEAILLEHEPHSTSSLINLLNLGTVSRPDSRIVKKLQLCQQKIKLTTPFPKRN